MTDQPKWTPGPWFIVTPTQGFEVCTIHGVEQQPTEDGLGQTWVYIRPESLVRDGEWHWPDEVECTANARLIASAPDLFAGGEAQTDILRRAQAILTQYLIPDGIDGPEAINQLLGLLDGPDQRASQSAWDAALAKARGETK